MRAAMATACAQETVCFGEKLVFPVPFMIPRLETARTPAAYQLPDGTSENAPGCAPCGS